MADFAQKWLKIKKSGHFKRQIKQNYLKIVNTQTSTKTNNHTCIYEQQSIDIGKWKCFISENILAFVF